MFVLVSDKQQGTDHDLTITANEPKISQGRELVLSIIKRADQITGAADTSHLVEDMLDLMIELTRADSANFFQLDTDSDELVITHVRGETESQYLIGLRLNHQQGLPGISLYETKTMVVDEQPSDLDWLRSVDPVNAARKKNVINLPVNNNARNFGIIQIFNFHQAELDLLTVLGTRLAVELNRRREMDSVQRSNKRLLMLIDILREVSGIFDRNHLLHLVTESAAHLVNAERSSLFLVDPTSREMVFQVAYQPPEHKDTPSSVKNKENKSGISGLNENNLINPSRQSRLNNFSKGEFSYFNRTSITVPLRSESLVEDHDDVRKHIFGGLMVLNKPNASFQEEDAQLMGYLANQVSIFLQVGEMYESSGELFLGVIRSLVAAIDAKDPYTQGHSQRVSDYSVSIARELGVDESLINDLRIGSLLHDIGKIGIPDSILQKNGALSTEEMELIREHPRTGVSILSQVNLLDPMRPAIAEHHERLDGSGYPAKLTDKQISWMGKIVAVADVFDAMNSNRPYRQALSGEDVLSYLNEKRGTLFDPPCIQALENILARSN